MFRTNATNARVWVPSGAPQQNADTSPPPQVSSAAAIVFDAPPALSSIPMHDRQLFLQRSTPCPLPRSYAEAVGFKVPPLAPTAPLAQQAPVTSPPTIQRPLSPPSLGIDIPLFVNNVIGFSEDHDLSPEEIVNLLVQLYPQILSPARHYPKEMRYAVLQCAKGYQVSREQTKLICDVLAYLHTLALLNSSFKETIEILEGDIEYLIQIAHRKQIEDLLQTAHKAALCSSKIPQTIADITPHLRQLIDFSLKITHIRRMFYYREHSNSIERVVESSFVREEYRYQNCVRLFPQFKRALSRINYLRPKLVQVHGELSRNIFALQHQVHLLHSLTTTSLPFTKAQQYLIDSEPEALWISGSIILKEAFIDTAKNRKCLQAIDSLEPEYSANCLQMVENNEADQLPDALIAEVWSAFIGERNIDSEDIIHCFIRNLSAEELNVLQTNLETVTRNYFEQIDEQIAVVPYRSLRYNKAEIIREAFCKAFGKNLSFDSLLAWVQ